MYKKIEILISPKELLVVTLRIDNILNAYNQFHIDINLYQTRKTPEPQYTFNGKLYWGLKDYSREEWQSKAITAIPQLATLLPLVNCDTFGIDTHIISNGFYFLKNQEYNALKENYRFTNSDIEKMKEYSKFEYVSFVAKLIETRFAQEAKVAIEIFEELTNQKFIQTDLISPTFYNELHYNFISKSQYNVYPELNKQKQIIEYPMS